MLAPRIFLSYARADDDGLKPESLVRRLYDDLTAQGCDAWWDRASMPSRALTFLDEIKREIESSSRLVLIVGPHTAVSDYVREEWQYALSLCKPVTPALITDDYGVLPRQLQRLDARAFWNEDRYTDELATLVRQLRESPAPLGLPVGVEELTEEFIARPEDLDALKQLVLKHTREVGAPRIAHCGLRGMGGVGKSVLARALARDCEVRLAFPDNVFWLKIDQGAALVRPVSTSATGFSSTDWLSSRRLAGSHRLRLPVSGAHSNPA